MAEGVGHADRALGETTELLRTMIRNRCVNDGTPGSGQEVRNVDVLDAYLGRTGFDVQRFEPLPGRTSLVARMSGSDPAAPSLCLMGHTDVVPADRGDWRHDPFGGELIDGEVWGRGAVDMLNLTASMAVAFGSLARSGFRPRGDLVLLAVADEEAGGVHGAQWLADHEPEAIAADYVLTENGGLHLGAPDSSPRISVNVGEKGVAWRRLRAHGEAGHGSMPWRGDNALVTAAAVVHRLARYRPEARLSQTWRDGVAELDLPDDVKVRLTDPDAVDEALTDLPDPGAASYLHACCHTTVSPNAVGGASSTNVIPDVVDVDVDIRTLPGETAGDVAQHLEAALGDLAGKIDVYSLLDHPPTQSPAPSPLWESLERAVQRPFPGSTLVPGLTVGFTDARFYRRLGATVYGAGLFSPAVAPGEYSRRFHGRDERIDLLSLALTTRLWGDVARDLVGPS